MHRLAVTIIALLTMNQLIANTTFDKYFKTGALRIDFELIGNNSHSLAIITQKKQLAEWGGSPTNLIDRNNMGTLRCSVYDLSDGQLIFSHGFCSLFMEWKTTAEAKKKMASYYQAVYIPNPKADFVFKIEERDKNNNWVSLVTDTMYIADYFTINEIPFNYEYTDLLKSGSSRDKIDLIILPEGYTSTEMEKFLADAKRLTDSLFLAQPFNRYKNRFNVKAIKVPSLESGTDIPGNNIYRNTAFNSHFYTFNSARYLTTSDMKAIYDVLDGFPHDQIYVLVNSSTYGGGGFYNYMNLCTSDNDQSPFVFIHEFGHGFAGLADEYYTSDTSYEEFYNVKVEPWEPNITTLVAFEQKWKNMIGNNIPVPTPRNSQNSNIIGVFEGGGYVEKGVFSPAMTCWMKERVANKFCPVCEKAIENAILKLSK